MPLPSLSIVTPSFNQAGFIEETILSVLDQDYPELEYRIQDGGSTDGSVEIIRRYERRLAGWISEKDEGHADAVERGFSQCGGDILGFINSDDTYLPGALRAAGEAFAAHPELDLVYGDCLYTAPDGRPLVIDILPRFDFQDLKRVCVIPQPAAFWRRSVFEAAGGFDKSFYFSFDYAFFLRVAERGRVMHIPRLMATFRQHGAAKTSLATERWAEDDSKLRREYMGREQWNRRDRLRLHWLTARQVASICWRRLRGERLPCLTPARWHRLARRKIERTGRA